MTAAVIILALASAVVPAHARELCAERPGQTTPPCTVERGRVVLETSLIGWSLQQSATSREDTLTIAQSTVRIGIADHGEIAIGLTPFATRRVRDNLAATVNQQSGVGDLVFAVKRSFGRADAPGVAIRAYVSAPVGRPPSGAGNWTAGAAVPVSIPFSDAIELSLTPEINGVVNGSGRGHHLSYGGAAGLAFKLTGAVSFNTDVRVVRDDDPASASTKAAFGTSVAYLTRGNLQLDVGGNFGVNRATPGVELYFGIAKQF